jgi:two-component system, NtrC family, response regulator AtoC
MAHHVTTVNELERGAEHITTERSVVPTSDTTSHILGHSVAISALRAQIRHLTSFDAIGNAHVPTLLLQGETGTGKGLVARVIHDSGPRVHNPFLEVNCAAIPEALLESELFGFEVGAFTDAKRAKPGLFEVASGGTLFLDEVDALPLFLQSKLLTAIESKRVRRLGAVADRAIDVKLIAAAPTSLSQLISAGRFRADLYHRLAVVLLQLPPLRERDEDILVLARHFLQRYLEAYSLPSRRLSRAAETWLLRYDWPGNVRELSHLMERVTLLSSETIIDPQVLERLCLAQMEPVTQPASSPVGGIAANLDEPSCIRRALLQAEGNVVRTARLLGISRGALRYRMRQYGIDAASCKNLGSLFGSLSRGTITPPALLPMKGWKQIASPVDSEDAAKHPLANQGQPGAGTRWERRSVAVLALSLTFPEAERLAVLHDDPWTVVARWEQCIVRILTGCGGTVLQRSPSMSIAAFGIHGILEQLPQHAVEAALTIRGSVAEMNKSEAREAGVEVRMAVHQGQALVDVQTRKSTARVLPTADTMTLILRLLGDAAPGELLLSPQVGHLVEGWYELQEREVLSGDRLLDRTTAYSVVADVLRENHPEADGDLFPQAGGPRLGSNGALANLEEQAH